MLIYVHIYTYIYKYKFNPNFLSICLYINPGKVYLVGPPGVGGGPRHMASPIKSCSTNTITIHHAQNGLEPSVAEGRIKYGAGARPLSMLDWSKTKSGERRCSST